ncbi:MAG: C69 family dipeptidase [Phycisphaerales bacterium]
MTRIDNGAWARHATCLLLAQWAVWTWASWTGACTTVMVGREATADGSVLMASSCDGDIMGLIHVMPAQQYPSGTKLPMYWNMPRPTTYREYLANVRKGYDVVGSLPSAETYRTILLAGNVESMTTGGMNEFGVTIAIEFIPMRSGLACSKGVVGPNSNHWTTSLIANGLMRAQTAREAVRIIGAMAEQYGFQYYRAPHAGVALPIADEKEIWLMEIFGPGVDWTASSGRPGAVWCAQRIPDGEVACSANRSRIGNVDLTNADCFMASANIFSLAESLGFWEKGKSFVWNEAYGTPGGRENSLREWRVLSLVAPSLGLKAAGDPLVDRYPFSVKPEKAVNLRALMNLMRDGYEGTQFDVTEDPAFNPGGKKSPLARPWGPPELFDLLGVRPQRAICTPTSGYVFVAQLRDWLPRGIGDCLWFAYGPAHTSCFVPVYGAVADLPDNWDHPADFTRIDRTQAQWNFRLVCSLANHLRYQDAMRDIQRVIRPAEERFLDLQPQLEKAAAEVSASEGARAAGAFVTDYTVQCMKQVGYAYHELVDYLMFQYLLGDAEVAPPSLPTVGLPAIPDKPVSGSQ